LRSLPDHLQFVESEDEALRSRRIQIREAKGYSGNRLQGFNITVHSIKEFEIKRGIFPKGWLRKAQHGHEELSLSRV